MWRLNIDKFVSSIRIGCFWLYKHKIAKYFFINLVKLKKTRRNLKKNTKCLSKL